MIIPLLKVKRDHDLPKLCCKSASILYSRTSIVEFLDRYPRGQYEMRNLEIQHAQVGSPEEQHRSWFPFLLSLFPCFPCFLVSLFPVSFG